MSNTNNGIDIFIKHNKSHIIHIFPDSQTVSDLRQLIINKLNFNFNLNNYRSPFWITHRGKLMLDDNIHNKKKLKEFNIKKDDQINVNFRSNFRLFI